MSKRIILIAWLVVGLAAVLTAGGAAPKIDARIRERAQSEAAVPVFIVLEHQPQREILQRAESANALYRQVAESRYRQAAGAEELRQGREAAEAVLLRTRQQAFQAIEQAVGAEQDALEGRLKGLGATRISRYLGINMLAAEIPASAIAALEADPEIARVFAVEKLYPQLATSVPTLGAPAFWNAGYTGQGESVGILDSGVRTNHPAFTGVPIVSQVFLTNGSTDPCFADNAGSAQDQFGHGTHVAGIVASQGSAGWTNYQGVAKGIGTLYNLKVGYELRVSSSCDPVGAESDPRDVVAALDWAVANTSLKIFNYSYGSPLNGGDDDGFTQSIDQYIDNYELTIAIAAGNGGLGQGALSYGVTSPGVAYNSITVGNWISRGVMNPSSSRGATYSGRDKPDLAAPGTNIYSAAYNWGAQPGTADDFVSMTGTSMAAPHIAGSAALLESAGVSDPLAVKGLLINTADSSGAWAYDSGWGYTNLNTALAQLNYGSGSLAAAGVEWYELSATGAVQATATWNRHMSGSTSNFNNIDLYLFRADNGATLASSTSTLQDVEQLRASYTGDALLAVTMITSPLQGVNAEPYGVAFSAPGSAVQASGPRISLACSLPSSVPPGSQVPVTCSVSNTGTLPAAAVAGQLTLSDGISAPIPISIGDIQGGSAASQSFTLGAPYEAGTYALSINVSTSSFFGSSDTNALVLVVSPALPAPAPASPANGATGVSTTPNLSWTAAAGATSYDVYLGTSIAPPLAASTAGPSYTPGALVPGTLYYWRVVAKNGSGSSSTGILSFTTAGSPPGPPQYVIATLLGKGPDAGGPVYQPEGVATDAAGNIYLANTFAGDVLKVAPDGSVIAVLGGGSASCAQFLSPQGVAVDASGDVYIADTIGQRICRVDANGSISTYAGNGTMGYSGDGGAATDAQMTYPVGVGVDSTGSVYIADRDNNRVRKVAANGIISTVAGNGTAGYSGDGGPATSAGLSKPSGVVADAGGNLYIADYSNHRVRKVAPDGTISTVAGTGTSGYSGDGGPAVNAQIYYPAGVAMDTSGNLYIADTGNQRIREVGTGGTITTLAGNGGWGYLAGGPATGVPLYNPSGVAAGPPGYIYISDYSNDVLRVVRPADPSCQYQVSETGTVMPSTTSANQYVWLAVNTGPTCTWQIAGLPSWLSVQQVPWGSPAGLGPASIPLAVAINSGPLRAATITVAGVAVQVMQAAGECSYAVSPNSFAPGGGTGSLTIITGPSCPWGIDYAPDWLTLGGPTSGIGAVTVGYSAAPNTGGARIGTLSLTGQYLNMQQAGFSGTALRFVPVTPCRVADTRGGAGAMGAAETRSFAIPQSGCGIPSSAQAYSLNVTVVPQGPLSYLTLWPTGLGQPLVSTLNSFGGIVVANAAIVPAGFNGAVSVYATDPTDVILDIDGYFDAAGTYAFYPVQPCRVADTRNAAGPFGGPALDGVLSRDFPVPASSCGLPATASAYSMNVTVVPGGYLGYLKTWPTGQAQPNVSTLNSWTGKVVANAALVPAGSGGAISVYAEDATQVVLDTNGYFGAPGETGGLNFYPVTPCRVADTRGNAGPLGGPKMGDGESRSFPIPSSGCGIPATAAAYSLNVTVVPDGMLQYLTVWPTGAGQPMVSTLNSWDGAVVANAAIVPAGTGGAISVFVANRTQVILDINGYFAP